ncbi:tetratricopeptide repeat protein, partial [uncultured Duncaniella sp.]
PRLRYSRLTASIDVIGKSDAEINQAFDSNPSSLTIDEILYAATLTDDLNRKKSIYAAAAKNYPNDYRGFNDLGMVLYQQGDFDGALSNFKKAASINPSAPEVQMNQGLVALVNNDFKAANQAFGKAGGIPELGSALGVYYLQQGDVNAAVKAFGNDKSNNAALAQLLSKDYSKAKSTLSAIQNPDATTYYLMAVLGARTNNEQMVTSNLRQAIKLDNKLAKQAANDLEFARFNVSNL